MDTDAFREFSTKYGLDFEKVASFCESFATHVDIPKEKGFKTVCIAPTRTSGTPTPSEQIKVERNVAMVKDLLVDNIDGHVIYFCGEAAIIAKPDDKDKNKPVVGMPIVSVKI